MKKYLKKITTAIICISMILSLFSCSSKQEVKEKQNEVVTETTKQTIAYANKIIDSSVDKRTGFIIVKFGKYEQDNDESNGKEDIEWIVIDKNDDTSLLLSKNVLDCKNFNDEQKEVTFAESSLHAFLNGEFVGDAFTDDERNAFGNMNTYGFGLFKNDMVSLLSIGLCEKYFGVNDDSKTNDKIVALGTKYAISKGVDVNSKNDAYKGCSPFFLSDNGENLSKAAWVGMYGKVYLKGENVKLDKGDGVRPLICLKNDIFDKNVLDAISSNVSHASTKESTNKAETETTGNAVIGSGDEGDNKVLSESNTNETTISSGVDNNKVVYSNAPRYSIQSNNVPSSEKNVVELSLWQYGRVPAEWVYVAPNTQIISNSRPNQSKKFAYKLKASSGPQGCYMAVFTKCDNAKGIDFDGRLYSFEDYTKLNLEEVRFTNKFSELKYSDYNVLDLLKKRYTMTEVSDGIYKAGNVYVNVIYVDELDDIIAKGK